MLFPEQKRANNPNNCFNWFLPGDTRRGAGEALSIRQMIDQMVEEHGIDRRRVFIVGLSAGGAMAAAMLAAYPEVFAGGAVIAGLPYGGAVNVQEALQTMAQPRQRSGEQWGDLVRSASSHSGPWPKISLWHGSADAIVNPQNMEEALKQWIDVHGVSASSAGAGRGAWTFASRLAHGRGRRCDRSRDHPRHEPRRSPRNRTSRALGRSAHFISTLASHQASILRASGTSLTNSRWPTRCRRLKFCLPSSDPHQRYALASASTGRANAGAEDPAWQDPRTHITAALKAAGLLRDLPGGSPTDPRRIITSTLRSVGLLKD